MPTTIFKAVHTGATHNTFQADNTLALLQGLRPAAGTYRVTAVTLGASLLGYRPIDGDDPVLPPYRVQPKIGYGNAGGEQTAELQHDYGVAVSLALPVSCMTSLLAAGGVSVQLNTNGAYYLREFEGCAWTLTVAWEYRYSACTAPTGVVLDAARKRLSITGGAGGTGNAMVGYGLEYRQSTDGGSTWGAWTSLGTVGASVALSIGAGARRQYRARTVGEAGASYYSGYTVCAGTLVGNTGPGAVAVTSPATGAVSYSATPRVALFVPAEPDGDAQTVQLKADGGAWQDFAQLSGTGGTVGARLPSLSAGAHTLTFRLVDAQGIAGAETALSLTVRQAAWRRVIQPGTVIANAAISHRSDLEELYSFVNAQRAYFGLSALSPVGAVGKWEDWRRQIIQLRQGLTDCRLAAGETAPAWGDAPAMPTAAAINAIRGEAV